MGKSTLGQKPAFTRPTVLDLPDGTVEWGSPGISRRELFAAMAMQGMCAGQWTGSPTEIAAYAVFQADALIAELAKENS